MSQFGPEDDSKTLTNARAYLQAEERNCEVVLADDYTLQLDIDNDHDYEVFHRQLSRLQKYVQIADMYPEDKFALPYEEWKSRNGNRHVVIKLAQPLPVVTRIMLQACLGSDRTRELLNYARFLSGEEKAVLLFKPKPKQLPAQIEEEVDYI